jgi:hypothetical protein
LSVHGYEWVKSARARYVISMSASAVFSVAFTALLLWLRPPAGAAAANPLNTSFFFSASALVLLETAAMTYKGMMANIQYKD